MHDRVIDTSKFYLESVVNGYRETADLLKDGNNDRVTWVSAARILDHAQSLSDKITDPAHKEIHQIALKKYRYLFVQYLGFGDSSKSGAFFYGVSRPDMTIDEAAVESTDPEKGKNKTIGSDVRAIPERAVYVIWKFCQLPKNFEEPLRGRFTEEGLESMRPLWPSLHEYLVTRESISRLRGS